ncbi:MAG: SOS-response transcriptional repressor, LexA [Chlorobi bacterium]|nr:SOS-response transcriptional repressor, LexA [Chlorobiota bacterium]
MHSGERMRKFGTVLFGKERGTIKLFADALGMAPSNLQKYLSGKPKPGLELLEKMLDLGCSLDWLATGEGEMVAFNGPGRALRIRLRERGEIPEVPESNYRAKEPPMPIFTPNTDTSGYTEGTIDLNETLAMNRQKTLAVRIVDEAMTGAGIDVGDIVVGARAAKPKSGDIVIAKVRGSIVVRRYVKENGVTMLMPQGSGYNPTIIKENSRIEILAVVRHTIHSL